MLFIFSLLVATFVIYYLPKATADHYSGGFASGHLTYGIGNGSSATNAVMAASQWNGVSSNVSLTYSSATNTYGSTAHIVTYFNHVSAPTSGDWGYAYLYKSYTGTSALLATENDTFVKAILYQYIHPDLNTSDKQIHTSTHEFGHALSVAHPSWNAGYAVMNQGVSTNYSLQSYDTLSLKDKWGN